MKAPTIASLAARAVLSGAEAFGPAKLSILIFHRVTPQPDPIFPGEVHARRFDELMGMVARCFSVFTLGEALDRLDAGRLPARSLVITFDDGYADNAEIALPILQRHQLKATFFIATGFLDGGRMFNDTVIECLRRTSVGSIDLSEWGAGVRPLGSVDERREAILALVPKVKYLSLAQRETLLARLLQLAGSPALPNDLMMRSEQVLQMHRAGMELGGHTANHPILRLLQDDEAEAEIARGREQLQQLIGAPVQVFAYPNGRPMQDYDARHVAMVRRLGFRAAVTTGPGLATVATDRHQLPRFTPWDIDSGRWLARLVHSRVAPRRAEFAAAA